MSEQNQKQNQNENPSNGFEFVEYSPEAAERIGYSDYSYWKSVFQNFLKKKSAVFMAFVFFALIIFSFIALKIGKYDYSSAQIMSDASLAFTSPNGEFWFGTDNLGRDYWCQVWYAAQISIKLALIVALGECVLGVTIGCIWGYVRSLDRIMTEIYNVINNIPTIIYMTLAALLFGQSFRNHGDRNDHGRLACDGEKRQKPRADVPRPRVQPGIEMSRNTGMANSCEEHFPVSDQRDYPASGSVDPADDRSGVNPVLPWTRTRCEYAVPRHSLEKCPQLLLAVSVSADFPGGHRIPDYHHFLSGGKCILGCGRS